ncbi:hypothetical protein KC329_g4 [Hortaea werneckii]|nr:hypothetical protein KC329_g4 [Hortaea werneckii]
MRYRFAGCGLPIRSTGITYKTGEFLLGASISQRVGEDSCTGESGRTDSAVDIRGALPVGLTVPHKAVGGLFWGCWKLSLQGVEVSSCNQSIPGDGQVETVFYVQG